MTQHVHYPGTYMPEAGTTVIPVYCGNHVSVILYAGGRHCIDPSKGEPLRLPVVSANTAEVTCPDCQARLAEDVEEAVLNVRHLFKGPGGQVWCGATNVAQIRQYENEADCRTCLDNWRYL